MRPDNSWIVQRKTSLPRRKKISFDLSGAYEMNVVLDVLMHLEAKAVVAIQTIGRFKLAEKKTLIAEESGSTRLSL